MTLDIITRVIDGLNQAGLPAQAAFPGGPMSAVTEARAAVSLEKLEHTARSATVLVTVLSPAAIGGSACETAALTAGQVMEGLGGICQQEACRFQGYADAYYVRVLGTFHAGQVSNDWASTSGFSVKIGDVALPNAVAFKAQQAVDDVTGTPLSTAVWSFRIQEEYGRGQVPPPLPDGTFTITVTRSGGREVYRDCVWTSGALEDTPTGLRWVRTGVAASRAFLSVI